MEHRCDRFLYEVERLSKKKLKLIDDQKEESALAKNVCDASSATAILFGIGGGLAIAMGVTTLGIGSFVGAAAVAATLVVKKIDSRKNRKKFKNLEKCLEDECHKDVVCAAHYILTIIKEGARELSRIFEHQLFELENSNDVTMVATCAVNLMLKLKTDDEFSRSSLLSKVFSGSTDKQDLKTRRNRQKWKVPDVLQKPGLRKQILVPAISSVKFEYFSKPGDFCEPKMYGYRGEILKMVCNDKASTAVGGNDSSSSCCSIGADGTSRKVNFFIECGIDKEYTEPCEEASDYSPFHLLVKCPKVLEKFASNVDPSSRPSLRDFVSKMYYSRVRHVRPVFRSHSSRIPNSLSNTDLSGSDFSRVHFTGSNLENCYLNCCIILFGELKDVNLSRSRFTKTHLSHCNLTGATAQRCEWTATEVLHSCLDHADLRGCNNSLGGNKWTESSFEDVKQGELPPEVLSTEQDQDGQPELNPKHENGIPNSYRFTSVC